MEIYLGIALAASIGYAALLRNQIESNRKIIGMLEAQTVKLEFMITEYQMKVTRNEELLADYINNMHGKVETPQGEGKELADATNDLLTGDLFDIDDVAFLSSN